MHLQTALDLVATYAAPDRFEDFRTTLPAEWIERALEVTGTATVRTRRLPAEHVVWLCIGMGMYRDRPIDDLVEHLGLVLPDEKGRPLARSAPANARRRLGDDALHWLFGRTARAWGLRSAQQFPWRGLSLFGVDGTTKEVPDSEDNRLYFGGPTGARGPSGYPLVRLVALMALRSHVLVGAEFGPYADGELHYARLLLEHVPGDSLTVLDRAFVDAKTLIPLARGGKNRHWLTRAKKNTVMRPVKRLGPGDELVELNISPAARKADPTLPERWIVRALRYQRPGYKEQTLLTSLIDAEQFPAAEVVDLYHERWELELGYDEIKTELLQREETLRSQSPAAISQELYGILLAYNLIRKRMEHVADLVEVEPTRISFVMSLRQVRAEWDWLAVTKAGAIPVRLHALDARIARFILPPRRKTRVAPRAVKIKMSRYPRKRPTTTSPTEGVIK